MVRWSATLNIVLGAFCVFTAANASAQDGATQKDVLVFANGDQLSGKLLRGVNDTVVFHSDMAGDITVPLSKIKELRTNGSFAVLQHGVPVEQSRQVKPERLTLENDNVLLQPMSGPEPAPIPVKQVAYIVDGNTFQKELLHRAGPFDGWTGAVNLGGTLVQATQHGGTLTAGAGLVRQVPTVTYFRARNKTTFNLQETYGIMTTPVIPQTTPATPDSVVRTSIFHADLERDEYYSKKAYYLGNASFDHNYALGLQLQQIYGVGVGYTPFSTPLHQLDLKADVHYEKQEFLLASSNQNLIGSTLSDTYRRTLPLKMVLTQSASILPAWNNLNAYAANGSLGLLLPVLKRMSINFTTIDNFINNPSPGSRKNSLQFTSGLTYTLQ